MTIQSDMALLAAGSYWDIRKEDDEFNNDAPLPEGWRVVDRFNTPGSGPKEGLHNLPVGTGSATWKP